MTSQSLTNLPPSVPPSSAGQEGPGIKQSSRVTRHLAQAVQLEESGTNPLIRFTMLLAGVAVLAFVLWAGLTTIDEVAVSEGQVIPDGQVQQVQHLEGGIVETLLVKEGELVNAGQPLVKLSPAASQADLEQIRAREAALQIKAERLRAFADGRAPDFSFAKPEFRSLVSDNQAIFTTQSQARDNSQAVILSQIEQKRSDLRLLENQKVTLAAQVAAITEQLHMREELLSKGLVSRVLYLENKREQARLQGEMSRVGGQAETAHQALAEAENRLSDQKTTLYKQTMDEYGTVIGELAQVQESIARLQDRVTRLDVISPVRGYVKGLVPHNPGTVIQPGGLVCEVVPVGLEMKVEARVQPRDVGHIKIGQKVKVKVTAFDFARYGSITGRLEAVSASSFMTEKGEPYFKAMVVLDKDHVGPEEARHVITPGMTVQAEIVTGDKTLLQYLLKPIFTQMQQSFHER